MNTYFAVALVLGTAVVHGIKSPPCSFLQQDMLRMTGLAAGRTKAVEASKFENDVALRRIGESAGSKMTRKDYVVQPDQGDSLPSVSLYDISYKLYSIQIIPLNAFMGTAAMELVFEFEEPGEEPSDISFFVPLLAVDKGNPSISADFSAILGSLNSVPEDGTHTINLQPLEPLLKKLTSTKVPTEIQTDSTMENVKLYLTDCETVAIDAIYPKQA